MNHKADIWALGCVVYWLFTSDTLFSIEVPDNWDRVSLDTDAMSEDIDMEQMARFIQALGPVPDSVRAQWEAADDYLPPEDYLAEDGTFLDPLTEGVEVQLPLGEAIRRARPDGMGDDELEALVEFVGLMIRYDPADRKSTAELLQHRWLTDFETD